MVFGLGARLWSDAGPGLVRVGAGFLRFWLSALGDGCAARLTAGSGFRRVLVAVDGVRRGRW